MRTRVLFFHRYRRADLRVASSGKAEILNLVHVGLRRYNSLTPRFQMLGLKLPIQRGRSSMSIVTSDYDDVLLQVRHWPVSKRVALVQDVLRTLFPAPESVSPRPKNTLSRALGLLQTELSAPTDAEVETWLAEHRLGKYG